MKIAKGMVAAGIVLTILSGCRKDKDDNNPNLTNNNNNNGTELSQKDKDFMNQATYTNLAEVQTGNMAKQKASDQAISNYGGMMVSDHGNAHNQLSDIAQNMSFSLPTETDQEHKDMANMLMNMDGRMFDSAYIHMMVTGHEKAIALFQDEAVNGKSADIKSYANAKIPVLQHHHDMADSLAKALYP